MYDPSGACLKAVEDWVWMGWSSAMDDRNATAVVIACCRAS